MRVPGRWRLHERLAVGVLAASFVLLAAAVVNAVRIESLPSPGLSPVSWKPMSADLVVAPELSPSQYAAAVEKDPFHPERRRPAMRYLLPDEAGAQVAEPPAVQPSPDVHRPPIRLLGTTVLPDGRGLAVLARDGEPPRLLRVGESWDGLEVRRVGRGSVTLVSADSTTVLRLPGLGRP